MGSGCALNTVTGGAVANLPGTSNPVFSMTRITWGIFLYIVNKSSTLPTSPATSSISAFSIVDTTTGKLQPITAGGTENPYAVGAGPVCMVEDRSFKYIYTSNTIDGSFTGKQINKKTGQLSDLQRGSKFPATGQAVSWLSAKQRELVATPRLSGHGGQPKQKL